MEEKDVSTTPTTYRSSHFLPLALQGPTVLLALDSHLPLPILTFHSLPLVFYSSSSSQLLNRLSLRLPTFPSFVWPGFVPKELGQNLFPSNGMLLDQMTKILLKKRQKIRFM